MKIDRNISKVIKVLLEDISPQMFPQQNQTQNPSGPQPQNDIIQVNQMDDTLRGGENPIKGLIDKIVDDKNGILQNQSNMEIQKLINNA